MEIKTKYRKIKKGFKLKSDSIAVDINKLEPDSVRNSIQITWDHAENFSVFDNKGNKWIDFTSGIFVTNAGHSNPSIKKAIKKQIDNNLLFSYNYPTKIKRDFIKKLLSISPKHFNKVTLLNSGSEAVDAAYKLIKIWGNKNNKKYIIVFRNAYHGRGLANDFISGNKNRASWSNLNDKNVKFINFPYNESDKFNEKSLPPKNQIAGFILETFQGWGAWFYPKEFITGLTSFTKKNKILLCFDEMQSGFYRLGPLYGYTTYGKNIKPDILCLGKGISSSLPISAVLTKDEIINIDKNADLHGTQSGNPLSCAAALANIEFLSKKSEIKKRNGLIKKFELELKKLEKINIIKKVNVRGLIAGLIFKSKNDAKNVLHTLIKNGILPVDTGRESIKLAPPLTISKDALTEALNVIKEAIKKYDI